MVFAKHPVVVRFVQFEHDFERAPALGMGLTLSSALISARAIKEPIEIS
jgi:hypothetical protein